MARWCGDDDCRVVVTVAVVVASDCDETLMVIVKEIHT
jgi:hypothetical protein